jgi:hypothetical protein
MNLPIATLITHLEVDLLLVPGVFRDIYGNKSLEVVGTDDVKILITCKGTVLGIVGDVTGDGEISAYDAALLVKSIIYGRTALPANEAALQANALLAAYGYSSDIMAYMADADGSGDVSSYDASVVLRWAAGITAAPASAPSSPRRCKLSVSKCDDQGLDVSIDLDDVSNIYSADIVMTYNPQILAMRDVSRASSVSGWLFEHGEKETPRIRGDHAASLRVSLAGVSPPASDGSLVILSFNTASADAIKQLDITECRLNGGRLKTEIENLPKTFALLQNYPNPFNPETWIPYQLSEPADVTITIYNVNGNMVRQLELGHRMPDHYTDRSKAAYWDGRNESGEKVSSGLYFYRLQAGKDALVGKMIIIR